VDSDHHTTVKHNPINIKARHNPSHSPTAPQCRRKQSQQPKGSPITQYPSKFHTIGVPVLPETPQCSRGDGLEAVEELKYSRDGQQRHGKLDHPRVVGVKARDLPWKHKKRKGRNDLKKRRPSRELSSRRGRLPGGRPSPERVQPRRRPRMRFPEEPCR